MGAREILADLALAGLAVTVEDGRLSVRPGTLITEDQRQAIRAMKPVLLDYISGRDSRRAALSSRLLAWRWSAVDVGAALNAIDSRSDDDCRRLCAECAHYIAGSCTEHTQACLSCDEIGTDLAKLLQNCPAFKEWGN